MLVSSKADLRFEWDKEKNRINRAKHGVSFEEAQTVFYDEYAWLEYDEDHSDIEERFRILGRSTLNNLLVVVHCIREEETIRIISSRKATASETGTYERNLYL